MKIMNRIIDKRPPHLFLNIFLSTIHLSQNDVFVVPTYISLVTTGGTSKLHLLKVYNQVYEFQFQQSEEMSFNKFAKK